MDALVVELVDTQDLKSCGHCGRAGSSPARGTKAEVAQLVEHNLAKVRVASSSLVFRSKTLNLLTAKYLCMRILGCCVKIGTETGQSYFLDLLQSPKKNVNQFISLSCIKQLFCRKLLAGSSENQSIRLDYRVLCRESTNTIISQILLKQNYHRSFF